MQKTSKSWALHHQVAGVARYAVENEVVLVTIPCAAPILSSFHSENRAFTSNLENKPDWYHCTIWYILISRVMHGMLCHVCQGLVPSSCIVLVHRKVLIVHFLCLLVILILLQPSIGRSQWLELAHELLRGNLRADRNIQKWHVGIVPSHVWMWKWLNMYKKMLVAPKRGSDVDKLWKALPPAKCHRRNTKSGRAAPLPHLRHMAPWHRKAFFSIRYLLFS